MPATSLASVTELLLERLPKQAISNKIVEQIQLVAPVPEGVLPLALLLSNEEYASTQQALSAACGLSGTQANRVMDCLETMKRIGKSVTVLGLIVLVDGCKSAEGNYSLMTAISNAWKATPDEQTLSQASSLFSISAQDNQLGSGASISSDLDTLGGAGGEDDSNEDDIEEVIIGGVGLDDWSDDYKPEIEKGLVIARPPQALSPKEKANQLWQKNYPQADGAQPNAASHQRNVQFNEEVALNTYEVGSPPTQSAPPAKSNLKAKFDHLPGYQGRFSSDALAQHHQAIEEERQTQANEEEAREPNTSRDTKPSGP